MTQKSEDDSKTEYNPKNEEGPEMKKTPKNNDENKIKDNTKNDEDPKMKITPKIKNKQV